MKHRKERMEQRVKDELTRLFDSELRDERLAGVTIVRVRCSGDLRHARVGIDAEGDAARREATLAALEGARGAIRASLADRVSGQFVPDFTFYFDDTDEFLSRLSTLAPADPAAAAPTENPEAQVDERIAPPPRGIES